MGVTALSVPIRPHAVAARSSSRPHSLLIAAATPLSTRARVARACRRRSARPAMASSSTARSTARSRRSIRSTGATRALIGGASTEQYPTFSNDGTRLVFARIVRHARETDFVAQTRTVRTSAACCPAGRPSSGGTSPPAGDRAILSRDVDGARVVSIVDMATGRETPLATDPALGIDLAMFRPGHDEIIYEHVPSDGLSGTKVYIGPGDGTGDPPRGQRRRCGQRGMAVARRLQARVHDLGRHRARARPGPRARSRHRDRHRR